MLGRKRRWLRTGVGEARPSLVTVLGTTRGETVGCGVYLGEGQILTCAHVVNEALGRDWFAQEAPTDLTIDVSFPAAESCAPVAARTTGWIPARYTASASGTPRLARSGDPVWFGDLALLRLSGEAPAAVRAMEWTMMVQGQEVRAWYAGGQSFTYADGRVQSCEDKLGFVDSPLRGAAMGPGYSGGPLWCEDEGSAVGLIVGVMEPPSGQFRASQVVRRTIVLPWQTIQAELAALEARQPGATGAAVLAGSASQDGERPGTAVDSATRHSLTTLVTALLSDPGKRAEQGRRLAEELGLETTRATPSVDDIVTLLLTRHRAMATFVEGLPAGDREPGQKLLALGRAALVSGLLSVREHQWLLDLMSEDVRARFPESARAALPHTTLFDRPPTSEQPRNAPSSTPSADAPDADGLISALEEFWGDSAPVPDGSPRVPALLRTVEYLAATCVPKRMQDFWVWSEQVAQRIGVAKEALGERREDAADWARRRRERTGPSSPRLTVRLTHCEGGTYQCAAWYDPGSGTDAMERQVVATDEPCEPAKIVRLLHAVLVRETRSSAVSSAAVPLIEVLLGPEDLDIAVDRWDNDAQAHEMPVVLGAEYAVTVRCPELRRQAPESLQHWRSRWAQIDRSKLLRLDNRYIKPLQVYGLLKADLDVARVVVECAPQHRAAVRAVCLALGVPVVVWDRKAVSRSSGDQLTALLLNGPARGLPHRVRRHRARVLAESDGAAIVEPALVWDDASRPPPRPVWTDPTEEEATP